jgi:ABC-type multidrug transport system fused ATPase/permease subunit
VSKFSHVLPAEMLKKAFNLLSNRDRLKLKLVVALQFVIGLLDLMGVLLIGVMGSLSFAYVSGIEPDKKILDVLTFLGMDDFTEKAQLASIVTLSFIFLTIRSVFSICITKRTLRFFSLRGASISSSLISKFFTKPLNVVESKTTQEVLFATTRGVDYIVLQILAPSVILVSDLALLAILCFGLLVADPTTAVICFAFFFLTLVVLNLITQKKAATLGLINSQLNIESNDKIIEAILNYRDLVVRNRRSFYSNKITYSRRRLAGSSAEIGFLPYVSKYLMEFATLFAVIFFSLFQFATKDTSIAFGSISLFLVASSRIAPATLRIQQGMIQIRGGIGAAAPTFELIDLVGGIESSQTETSTEDSSHFVYDGFSPTIFIENLTFRYASRVENAISGVSLEIPAGKFVAIVGPSGAGKTTLVDLVLGILNPDSGRVLISEVPPLLAHLRWPGAVAYVPQEVALSSGTIAQNISLGFPELKEFESRILSCVDYAQLSDLLADLPLGLDTQIGERGSKMSGGQRQRIGIARALFSSPRILVLDEATSALDGKTEMGISDSIRSLRGSTTVLVIAHRLSTIRRADAVIYLEGGKVRCQGTFEEVSRMVPEFDSYVETLSE